MNIVLSVTIAFLLGVLTFNIIYFDVAEFFHADFIQISTILCTLIFGFLLTNILRRESEKVQHEKNRKHNILKQMEKLLSYIQDFVNTDYQYLELNSYKSSRRRLLKFKKRFHNYLECLDSYCLELKNSDLKENVTQLKAQYDSFDTYLDNYTEADLKNGEIDPPDAIFNNIDIHCMFFIKNINIVSI